MNIQCLIIAIGITLIGGGCQRGIAVTHVYDGDMIKVGEEKIRLIGVDIRGI